jgi:hypothetical protein
MNAVNLVKLLLKEGLPIHHRPDNLVHYHQTSQVLAEGEQDREEKSREEKGEL